MQMKREAVPAGAAAVVLAGAGVGVAGVAGAVGGSDDAEEQSSGPGAGREDA
jgi:hypothetical protein